MRTIRTKEPFFRGPIILCDLSATRVTVPRGSVPIWFLGDIERRCQFTFAFRIIEQDKEERTTSKINIMPRR